MEEIKQVSNEVNYEALYNRLLGEVKMCKKLKGSIDEIDLLFYEALTIPKWIVPAGSQVEDMGGLKIFRSKK